MLQCIRKIHNKSDCNHAWEKWVDSDLSELSSETEGRSRVRERITEKFGPEA
jgi:hypothetical protein